MYVEMDNITTKPSSIYDGSVNGILDQQTFNTNHIYIHPYLCGCIPKDAGLQLPSYLSYGLTNIHNTGKVSVSSILRGISIKNWSTTQT